MAHEFWRSIMPATNLGSPAALASNPSTGEFVTMSPFSGPKNSPFDARTITGWGANGVPTYANDPNNFSTGGLSTGIGFGANNFIIGPTNPQSVKDAGFNDEYTPGVTLPSGSAATTAILLAIGGGKSTANVAGDAPTVPYVAQPILGFGNGGSRDAGAGPAFTGFGMKLVLASGAVANGIAIETGFLNRTGIAMVSGQSSFGSNTTASAAVT
jgi:hypothetical protein